MFIFCDDLSGGGPVWLNTLWAQINAIAASVDTVLLPAPRTRTDRAGLRLMLHERRRIARDGPALCRRVTGALDTDGPNVLIVWAGDTRAVRLAAALDPVWQKFGHRVLYVCDTLRPEDVRRDLLTRYDAIVCACDEQAAAFEAATGRPGWFLPAHSDVLTFHSTGADRPIDLIVVGRRDEARHAPLFARCNAPESRHLFLDFTTRAHRGASAEAEARLLMATYARSRVAFCYETSGIPRFGGRSPLLARWVHAWSSGCTVMGTSPKGARAAALLDWEEAAIDLPADPEAAFGATERILSDEDGLARRRRRNVIAALERFDTRHRLRDLLGLLDLPVPARLEAGIAALRARAAHLAE